jgi:hypothetical protein
VEREDFAVLKNFFYGDFSPRDFTENTVIHRISVSRNPPQGQTTYSCSDRHGLGGCSPGLCGDTVQRLS